MMATYDRIANLAQRRLAGGDAGLCGDAGSLCEDGAAGCQWRRCGRVAVRWQPSGPDAPDRIPYLCPDGICVDTYCAAGVGGLPDESAFGGIGRCRLRGAGGGWFCAFTRMDS